MGAEFLVLVVVRRAVHLGHRHVVHGGELGGELVPRGRQSLAVAAPGREELDDGHAASDRALEGVFVQELGLGRRRGLRDLQ